MAKKITLYVDVISPFAYLGYYMLRVSVSPSYLLLGEGYRWRINLELAINKVSRDVRHRNCPSWMRRNLAFGDLSHNLAKEKMSNC